MYQFKRKETEDALMRWIKNETLSHHENDTELFYEFVLELFLNEEKISRETFYELIEGEINMWGQQFTETDVSYFISKYEELYIRRSATSEFI